MRGFKYEDGNEYQWNQLLELGATEERCNDFMLDWEIFRTLGRDDTMDVFGEELWMYLSPELRKGIVSKG